MYTVWDIYNGYIFRRLATEEHFMMLVKIGHKSVQMDFR